MHYYSTLEFSSPGSSEFFAPFAPQIGDKFVNLSPPGAPSSGWSIAWDAWSIIGEPWNSAWTIQCEGREWRCAYFKDKLLEHIAAGLTVPVRGRVKGDMYGNNVEARDDQKCRRLKAPLGSRSNPCKDIGYSMDSGNQQLPAITFPKLQRYVRCIKAGPSGGIEGAIYPTTNGHYCLSFVPFHPQIGDAFTYCDTSFRITGLNGRCWKCSYGIEDKLFLQAGLEDMISSGIVKPVLGVQPYASESPRPAPKVSPEDFVVGSRWLSNMNDGFFERGREYVVKDVVKMEGHALSKIYFDGLDSWLNSLFLAIHDRFRPVAEINMEAFLRP
jgi:hypothetical protein